MIRLIPALVLLVAAFVAPARAYLQNGVEITGAVVPLRWATSPVHWRASDRAVPNVSAAAFQDAVARAFQTWQDIPAASIAFAFDGITSAAPSAADGVSVLGFEAHPDLDRVLGATDFVVDDITGEIVEANIFFNSIFPWSTAANGEPGRFDLQSVATHEIGHFIGLGHSALGETEISSTGGRRVVASAAVMFPIAFVAGSTANRVLQPDDVAGAADLYRGTGFRERTGVVAGRVLLNGRPVFGAHVTAFHLETGAFVGGFTLNAQGEFRIGGLPAGPHIIRVEPLDDADIDAFFDPAGVEIDFRTAFYPRLVVVPAGGVAPRIDVTVAAK